MIGLPSLKHAHISKLTASLAGRQRERDAAQMDSANF